MTRMRWLFGLVALPFALAAGCGGTINVDRDLEVKAFDIKSVIYTAKKDQELTVRFTATEPVSAYLVLEKDRDKMEARLADNVERPPEALDVKLNAKEGELKASVTGGNEVAAVIVGLGQRKPVQVKLKAVGK